ncbi:MAG: recombinase family protein [Aggregatilineales bacterium]
MSTKAALYARVSTDEQGKGYSLPTQLVACDKYADDKGYSIVGEFSDDFTGTKLDRPELDKIRALAKAGVIQKVVVYEVDRLSRKMAHQIIIEDEFKRDNVTIEYVLGEYADTPEGQLQKQVRSAISEYEREKIRERSLRGKKGRAQAGYIIPGGISRYGYRYVTAAGGHKGWYEIVPEEAHVVRMIYNWYVSGDETGRKLGTQVIARRLSELRIPTRTDGTKYHKKRDRGVWSKRTVTSILQAEIYAGTHYYNCTCTVNGKKRPRDKSEWIAIPVEPIIDHQLWEQAQQQAQENKVHSARNTKCQYLLQGRLKCETCGSTFRCYSDTRKATPLMYYCCAGQRSYQSKDMATITCHRSLQAAEVDEAIWECVKSILLEPEMILRAVQEKQAEAEKGAQVVKGRLESVEKQIQTLSRQREKLLDLYLTDDASLPKEMLEAKTLELSQALERFETEAEQLRRQVAQKVVSEDTIQAVKRFCEQAIAGIETFGFDEKKVVLDTLNVTGIVKRGESPETDTIILNGYLPETRLTSDAIEGITSARDIPKAPAEILTQLLQADPSSWSAFTIVHERKGTYIFYNPTHSKGRHESNVLHEISHLLCNHEPSKFVAFDGISYSLRTCNPEQEEEATWVCGCLKLPRKCLLWAVGQRMSNSDIAHHFLTNIDLVRFRRNVTGVDRQVGRRR